jgi:altronate hydrolase
MDYFTCDGILNGRHGIAGAGRQRFDPMPGAASGRRSMREQHGLGENAFRPWRIGAQT